jgi:ABC-2 type transport system ATP-binding protein
MIEVQHLHKRFGAFCAVDDVSFSIGAGQAFGLLGPNGAGKTTTIHMIAGVLAPDGGQVSIDGRPDPMRPELRRLFGVAPQELAVYEELSGAENLTFFGRLYGLAGPRLRERVDWALEFAGLADRRKDRAGKYSGGMKRRLNLACALVHEPRIMICDEPTAGVDPQSRNHILERIQELRAHGLTLLYTTHYIEEAQRLCDRVAIMDRGKVLALDAVAALIEQHGGSAVVEAELAEVPAGAHGLPGEPDGTTLRIETPRPLESVAALGRFDVEIRALRIDRPDLERVFLHLTGRRLRD